MTKTITDVPEVTPPVEVVEDGRNYDQYLARTALEHGPIFKWVVRMDPLNRFELIFLVGPEANRLVLHTHRECFSHDLGWTPVVGEWAGKGLLNMDPPEHTWHRRIWNPAFTSAYLASYLPVMHRVIVQRTRDWPERGQVDLFREAREITFDVAAAALAGFETGAATDQLREYFYTLLHGFDSTVETWEEFRDRRQRVIQNLEALLLRLIAERRREDPAVPPRDVLGTIVRARDESGAMFSDAQVLDHVKILLVAGHETTTTLGAWLLYLLSTHPDVLRRVEAELATVLGDNHGPLTAETARSLPFLDDVIREAGRLHPPVVTVPRGVIKTFEFAGYQIPSGTQVRLAIGASHWLPQVFANPGVFDPDRFAPPREEDKRTPYGLVTFGGGPRICIGVNFAQIEVKALAAYVLRTYRLEPVDDRAIDTAGFITQYPVGGLPVRVTARV